MNESFVSDYAIPGVKIVNRVMTGDHLTITIDEHSITFTASTHLGALRFTSSASFIDAAINAGLIAYFDDDGRIHISMEGHDAHNISFLDDGNSGLVDILGIHAEH